MGDFILPFLCRSQRLASYNSEFREIFYLHVNHSFSSWMSLTWNFCLILFLFLSLGVFPSGSLANQKKKKKTRGRAQSDWSRVWVGNSKRRVLWMWKKENGCFILLWGRDRGQVKLRALIWEWCYYRSLGVGYALNWEASHMRRQQRRITWGTVRTLLQWTFILFTTHLKCTSVMLRNQVTLLTDEPSLSWPIMRFISEPVLAMCRFAGALFRYWNLFSD